MIENDVAPRLSLNGEWQITIAGQQGTIQVPGVWELQGYSRDADHAMYSRTFRVPTDWQGKRILLQFGAVSYHAEVFLNGQPIGSHDGLWSAFELDASQALRFEGENHLEVHITKPSNSPDGEYPYRKVLVGFIPYVSTTFGGIWKDVELIALSTPAWKDIRILPDWHSGQVEIQAALTDPTSEFTAQVVDADGRVVAQVSGRGSILDRLTVPDKQSWQPGNPYLYKMILKAKDGGQAERAFGFRALHTQGDHLLFNGEPIHLRGILHWGWLPDKLAPIFEDEFVHDEFRRVREMGFNMVKLCLFVPTDNVFRIADEEGMFLWLEMPMWWQLMNPHLRKQAPLEYRQIMAAVHHHPSVIIYSAGCELEAHMADADLLSELDHILRGNSCNVLVCDNSGSGEAYKGLDFDFADFNDYHFYCELHQFAPLLDHFRRDWRRARPLIFGEFCAGEAYRDPAKLVDEDGKRLWWRDVLGVEGSLLRWAYLEQEERIRRLELPFSTQQLVDFSAHQIMAVRRFFLEHTRTRQGMGGYVVTVIRDTPITTSGLFDDFHQPRFDPEQFRIFNADAVLLLEQGRGRVWINGDRPAPVDRFNHYGGRDASFRIVLASAQTRIDRAAFRWQLIRPNGEVYAQGQSSATTATSPQEIARLTWTFPEVATIERWELLVELEGIAQNRWTLWVYPKAEAWMEHTTLYDPAGCLNSFDKLPLHDFAQPSEKILLTTALTSETKTYLRGGGRAIIAQMGKGALPAKDAAFWQEGLHLLYPHPVWENFAHQGYVDERFYHLAGDHAFETERFAEAQPEISDIQLIMRRLHTRLFTALDYVLEGRIGAGQFLACSLRLEGGLGDQVRSIQSNVAGNFLLNEMVNYLLR